MVDLESLATIVVEIRQGLDSKNLCLPLQVLLLYSALQVQVVY